MDKIWNFAYFLFRYLVALEKKGVFYRVISIEHIYFNDQRVFIDMLDHLIAPEMCRLSDLALLNRLCCTESHGKTPTLISPEVFLNLRLTGKTNIWIIGNIVYYLIEVY